MATSNMQSGCKREERINERTQTRWPRRHTRRRIDCRRDLFRIGFVAGVRRMADENLFATGRRAGSLDAIGATNRDVADAFEECAFASPGQDALGHYGVFHKRRDKRSRAGLHGNADLEVCARVLLRTESTAARIGRRLDLWRLLARLNQADYIILASQKLVDSIPRMPHRYPFTISYYQGLRDGSLGFDKVA